MTEWLPFSLESISELNACSRVQLKRKDGQDSFILTTPVEFDDLDIDTTTHWRCCDEYRLTPFKEEV